MSPEILSTLLQASGAAGVTAMFVYYLIKRDKKDQKMVEGFNQTINSYLTKDSKVKEVLAERLQEFADTNRELQGALKEVYLWNKQIIDENKVLKAQRGSQIPGP